MLSLQLSSMRAWSQRPETGSYPLRPSYSRRTRSEAEKQRQRWESSSPTRIIPCTELFSGQSLGAVSDGKLYLCYAAPEKVLWYGTCPPEKSIYGIQL